MASVEARCTSTQDAVSKTSTRTCELFVNDGTSLTSSKATLGEGFSVAWSSNRKFGEYVSSPTESGSNTVTYVKEWSERNNSVFTDVIAVISNADSSQSRTIESVFQFESYCSTTSNQTLYNESGDGTPDNPFVICNAVQASDLSDECNSSNGTECGAHFILGQSFTGFDYSKPIGHTSNPFTGKMLGNGRTLSDASYTSSSDTGARLAVIGYAGSGAVIEQVNFDNISITSNGNIAAVAYEVAAGATVKNIIVQNSTFSGSLNGAFTGGAVSVLSGGDVIDVDVNFTANNIAGALGGLVGIMSSTAKVASSTVRGDLSGTGMSSRIGGITGDMTSGDIEDSYAVASINSSNWGGGLIGDCSNGIITKSYANTPMTSVSFRGGLVGRNQGSCLSTTSAYWNEDNSSANIVGDGIGVMIEGGSIGSADITKQASYEVTNAEFDFSSKWSIGENSTTPYLLRESAFAPPTP